MKDKKPKTFSDIKSACRNQNGTYNGAKALKMLSDILYPGNDITEQEIKEMWEKKKKESK